jgi:hypothetical protein
MLTRRATIGLLVSAALISNAAAEPSAKKKQQHHKNGHGLAKGILKQNGRHQIDKAGQASVSADVNNGKVTAMSASHPQKGNLPVRKVKSRKKMAEVDLPRVRLAANAEAIQLAQAEVYYYAWVFDDGVDEYYYWYPAEVVIVDASWIEITF